MSRDGSVEHVPGAPSPLLDISNAMVRLYKETFGRGPTKARAHFAGPDTLAVLLEDTLTVAERRLVALGEHERVREHRLFLQLTCRGPQARRGGANPVPAHHRRDLRHRSEPGRRRRGLHARTRGRAVQGWVRSGFAERATAALSAPINPRAASSRRASVRRPRRPGRPAESKRTGTAPFPGCARGGWSPAGRRHHPRGR